MAKRLLFIPVCFVLLLASCFDKKAESTREVELEGMKITLSALSAKDVEAGVTGAPHTPLIIPYVSSEKSLLVTMTTGNRLIVLESYSNMERMVKKRELEEMLNDAKLKVSPDKKHIAYTRNFQGRDTFLFVHLLEGGIPFLTVSTQKDFEQFPEGLLAPEKIADLMIRPGGKCHGDADPLMSVAFPSSSLHTVWNALGELPPGNPFDYTALSMWDSSYYARLLVSSRCGNWDSCSVKWKEAVKKKVRDHYTNYKPGGDRSVLDIDNGLKAVSELLYAIRDTNLITGFHAYLCARLDIPDFHKQFLYDRNYYGASEKTRVFAERMDAMFADACKRQLKGTTSAHTACGFLEILWKTGDTVHTPRFMEILSRNWPGDSLVNTTLHRFSHDIPEGQKSGLKQKALTALNTKDSAFALNLLEDIATCEEIKGYHEKYGKKFYKPGCPEGFK